MITLIVVKCANRNSSHSSNNNILYFVVNVSRIGQKSFLDKFKTSVENAPIVVHDLTAFIDLIYDHFRKNRDSSLKSVLTVNFNLN